MGFFDYFFSGPKKSESPKIQFGRFSDAYKDELKYDAWDASLAKFNEEEYLEAYKLFFDYLSDDSIENLNWSQEGEILKFEFFQGSKKITGTVSNSLFQAEAKIAKTTSLHIGFLRRLLEENFHLKYCRYALDKEDNITVVFASNIIDASPYKVYYSLRELATHADKKDDILISEFDNLEPINIRHIRAIEQEEIQTKYDYCNENIDKAFELINSTKLNISSYPGAESYLYLDLIYKIDFLVKPEGNIMEIIDEAHNLYFHNKLISAEQKNRMLRTELKKIKDISFADFENEIYEVKSTFGTTQPSGLERIQDFINSELKNMDWYYENGHDSFSLAIPSYVVGYSLFNYSMPSPMRDFFHLYYQVVENEYFEDLKIWQNYKVKGKLNPSSIKKQIKEIVANHDSDYPMLDSNTKKLVFGDLCQFAKSYLLMIKNMNFQRKDNR